MAIPERPLVITIEPGDLTLDQAALFSVKGFDIFEFRQFLLDNSEWTPEEIGAIKLSELEAVALQIGEAMKKTAVPLVNSSG